jgi:hypothetical protein
MSPCRYGNDINKTIYFEKNWKTTSPELKNIADCAVSNLIPEKSQRQYDKCYNDFKEWCNKNNVKTVSEKVVLAYLMEKSKTVKSSTLWSTYSMLKLTLNIRDGIDVTKFLKLVPFLKKKSVGYQAKKSKVLTRDQINLFLEKASDKNYLLWKVELVPTVMIDDLDKSCAKAEPNFNK